MLLPGRPSCRGSSCPGFISLKQQKDLCKSRLTFPPPLRIMQSNQAKPMSKRSTWSGHLSESRGWWDHGRELSSEWTCEAAQTAKCSVASDGARTRYPGGAYECTWNERALCVNLGGTAGWFQVLSQIWGRAFFDSPDRSGKGVWRYETQYQTMARPVLQYQFPERTPFKYSVSKIGESIMMNLLKKLAACGLSLDHDPVPGRLRRHR